MDDKDKQDNPASDFNKLDLSQLQNFSFGTQWTQDKSPPAEGGERRERPRRDDRRDGPGEARRDRRAFRKPVGTPGDDPGTAEHPPGGQPRPRRNFRGGPRPEGGAPFRGPRGAGRGQPIERAPYDSPYFSATFYPEDSSFNALAKTIRASCRTVELFEIARTVVGKNDRFIVVLTRKAAEEGKQPIYLAVPDGMPFESEEDAVNHVMAHHLDRFFVTEEVEVDPPKGNFQVINKCGLTGELLGPPNYHRYNQIVQQHFAAKIKRMPLEAFRARIESVRDPEVVTQWLEQMKKITRYTWKTGLPAATPAAAAAPAEEAPVETTPEGEAAEATAETAEAPASVESSVAPTFDNLEDARLYLLSNVREKLVRTVDTARFHGNIIEKMPDGEIRRAIEGTLERQRRFPLDTANGLRGRLRREHFTIFKKGSKGVSYVCAVKRKFRSPGQTFSDSIGALIDFIEQHPMIKASELTSKFLGIVEPVAEAAPAVTEPPVPVEGGQPAAETAGTTPEVPKAELTIEQKAKIARMQGDLRWLVSEGYVTEFIDGRLFAAPPMVEARKREVDSDEHDPENYPDVPPETPTATAVAAATKETEETAAPAEPSTPATEAESAPEPAAIESVPTPEPQTVAEPVSAVEPPPEASAAEESAPAPLPATEPAEDEKPKPEQA